VATRARTPAATGPADRSVANPMPSTTSSRADDPELAARKAALRDRMRRLRRSLSPQERARLGELAGARLLGLPELARAPTVALFSSFGSEVPTASILDHLVNAQPPRRVLLPYMHDRTMHLSVVADSTELVATEYGPHEPAHPVAVDPREIDAVIVPGLAFDRAGFRLGYGGGNYDRLMEALRDDAIRIGFCFHAQVVKEVPHGPADSPVDLIVTDSETVVCRHADNRG
jgi:5-formyltetrahydrofolate cyclo-ligase